MIKGGKNNQIISFCKCMRSLLKAFLPIEMIKGKVLQNMFTLYKYAHCTIAQLSFLNSIEPTSQWDYMIIPLLSPSKVFNPNYVGFQCTKNQYFTNPKKNYHDHSFKSFNVLLNLDALFDSNFILNVKNNSDFPPFFGLNEVF